MYRLSLLLATVAAVPVQLDQQRYGPSAVPYGPSPPGQYRAPPAKPYNQPQPVYKEKEEEKFEPQPYKYEYGVQDDYSKAAFAKSESQDEVGAVTGSYKVNLPDGRIQTVSYTADPVNGYKAVVSYEGEPVYPPEPEGGYGNGYPGAGGYKAGPPARVYRETDLPLPGPEYVVGEDYLPEYIARVE